MCIRDRNDGLFKVKSIYFDDLDFELEDYLFEVSEHYLCPVSYTRRA